MICVSCHLIAEDDLQHGCFKDEQSAKKWLLKILNSKNYIRDWWTGSKCIMGVENIYNEIEKMDIYDVINGLEAPGDIKINITYQIEDKL